MINTSETKSLTINNVLYAKYKMGEGLIFIKIYKSIIPESVGASEDYLIALISLLEKKEFESVAYLNI